jgi:Peptidase family M28
MLLSALLVLPSSLSMSISVPADGSDQDHLKRIVYHLASFPNRNTNNPTLNAAAEWLAAEMSQIPGLKVEIMHYTAPKGSRVPVEKDVVQVVGVLPGFTSHKIIVGGHFDSINMRDPKNLDAVAPGANDDASGTALTIELARIASRKSWRNTLVFVCFSGEEQGLLGSTALAKRAKAEGWTIDAVLSNDIVGNGVSLNGQSDKGHVRIFSEESSTHNSRELARFVEWTSRGRIRGFTPKLVLRKDRFARGGDHSSFNAEGFTAVRFTESFEEFTRQHSPLDLPKFVDFKYLAKVVKTNQLALEALADADEAPKMVRLDPAQAHDTLITWKPLAGVKYVVYWRPTHQTEWQSSLAVGAVDHALIPKVNKDDYEFAVGAEGGVPVSAK